MRGCTSPRRGSTAGRLGRPRPRQPEFIKLKVPEHAVAARIAKVIIDNLRAEQALEDEAERRPRSSAGRRRGMDQNKLIEGIKQRLAKERGFSLYEVQRRSAVLPRAPHPRGP